MHGQVSALGLMSAQESETTSPELWQGVCPYNDLPIGLRLKNFERGCIARLAVGTDVDIFL